MKNSNCILILNLFVFVILTFRNELALQQMGTIFLVIATILNMPPVVVQISHNFQMETTGLVQVNNQILLRGN